MLSTERLPQILVPCNLVSATEGYATYREQDMDPAPAPEAPIFDVVNGGPITRATLRNAVERAITPPSPASVPANPLLLATLCGVALGQPFHHDEVRCRTAADG